MQLLTESPASLVVLMEIHKRTRRLIQERRPNHAVWNIPGCSTQINNIRIGFRTLIPDLDCSLCDFSEISDPNSIWRLPLVIHTH